MNWKILAAAFALGIVLAAPSVAEGLEIDRSRTRQLNSWKPQIQKYSERHYGESSWQLDPTCIVLHYTKSKRFPWKLVRSESFKNERPGVACHYVIKGTKVWEILPPDIRSRGAHGVNHRAINIEMVATDAKDLATKTDTLETCQKLCKVLMNSHGIEKSHIYGHEDVAAMRRRRVPEVLDLVSGAPYREVDPGQQNMETILKDL